jgi:hypothetical protein
MSASPDAKELRQLADRIYSIGAKRDRYCKQDAPLVELLHKITHCIAELVEQDDGGGLRSWEGFLGLWRDALDARCAEMVELTGAITEPEDTCNMADDKKGIELIIDRVEAVRVRIDSVSDELPAGNYEWQGLLREALAESMKLRRAWDVITANLALAIDEAPDAVAAAVRACVRDNEAKEKQIAELTSRGPLTPVDGDPEIRVLTEIMRLPPDIRARIADYIAARSK